MPVTFEGKQIEQGDESLESMGYFYRTGNSWFYRLESLGNFRYPSGEMLHSIDIGVGFDHIGINIQDPQERRMSGLWGLHNKEIRTNPVCIEYAIDWAPELEDASAVGNSDAELPTIYSPRSDAITDHLAQCLRKRQNTAEMLKEWSSAETARLKADIELLEGIVGDIFEEIAAAWKTQQNDTFVNSPYNFQVTYNGKPYGPRKTATSICWDCKFIKGEGRFPLPIQVGKRVQCELVRRKLVMDRNYSPERVSDWIGEVLGVKVYNTLGGVGSIDPNYYRIINLESKDILYSAVSEAVMSAQEYIPTPSRSFLERIRAKMK